MKVTEIITPNSNQLNEIEFPSFKMPKMRNPFKRGPKDEPEPQEHDNGPALEAHIKTIESEMLKATAGYTPKLQNKIQDLIQGYSEKWANEAVASSRANPPEKSPSLSSVWETDTIDNDIRVIFTSPEIQDIFTRLALAKRELYLSRPVPAPKTQAEPRDYRTKNTDTATDTTATTKTTKTKTTQEKEIDSEKLDWWQKMIKGWKDTPWYKKLAYVILYVPPAANMLDAVFLRPYLEYRQYMKQALAITTTHYPYDDNGKIIPLTLDKNGNPKDPKTFLADVNREWGKAAYAKSVTTFQKVLSDVFFVKQIVGAVTGETTDLVKLATEILLFGAAQKIPLVKPFEKYILGPYLASGLAGDMQRRATELRGKPIDLAQAFATLLWVDFVADIAGEGNYTIEELKAKGMVADFINQITDWATEWHNNHFPDPNDPTKSGDPTKSDYAKKVDAGENPADATTTNAPTAGGQPNYTPNTPQYESRQYWVRNYNGTKVKNPRTGLWESYKR